MSRYLSIILVSTLTGFANYSAAQELRDPTRPPAGLAHATGDGNASARRAGLNLQSILIAPDRRSAIIDGRLLRVGEAVSGFKVVAIEAGVVTLKGEQGTRRLQLFPAVDKRRSLTVHPAGSDAPASQGGTALPSSESEREEG